LALYRNPTVFWLASSDMALKAACALGALAAALLVAFPSLHPLWWLISLCRHASIDVCFFHLLYVHILCVAAELYSLSLVTVLGPFILLTEPMMVELSVLAAVLSPLKYTHTSLPLLAGYSCHLPSAVLRLFVFRLMLSAGLVKWFGSPKWRDLTAMEVPPLCHTAHACIFSNVCVSCVVCRVSCVVCRVSCVVCRVSCVVCRVSYDRCTTRRSRCPIDCRTTSISTRPSGLTR
jgi:hypothetical protein